jgi:hypothetical protein
MCPWLGLCKITLDRVGVPSFLSSAESRDSSWRLCLCGDCFRGWWACGCFGRGLLVLATSKVGTVRPADHRCQIQGNTVCLSAYFGGQRTRSSLGICALLRFRLELKVPLLCLQEWQALFNMDLLYCCLLQVKWTVQWTGWMSTTTNTGLYVDRWCYHGPLLHTSDKWWQMCIKSACVQTSDIWSTVLNLASMVSPCTFCIALSHIQAWLGIQKLKI